MRVAEVHEPSLGQHDDLLAVRELDLVDLRLDLGPLHVGERADLDLAVEVTDVADDRHVLHRPHVVERDDVHVAGRGDEDVGALGRLFHCHDLIAFHRRLKRADGVDLGDQHACATVAE